jgi:uncharacterized protein YneF (UPF0154 family)
LLTVNGLVYYLFLWMSNKLRFDASLYFLFMIAVFIPGIYSGYFFIHNQWRTERVKWLFFMENNGYILGMILSFVLFTALGINFLYYTPAALTVCLLAMERTLPDTAYAVSGSLN